MPYHNNPNHEQIERCLQALGMADTMIAREIISLTLYNALKSFIGERLDQLHYLLGRSWKEVEMRLKEKKIEHLLAGHNIND